MIIKPRDLAGVYEIDLSPVFDSRGYFKRVYDEEIFKSFGLERHWIQENHSLSVKKGTVRGLHFQFPPFTESKLVRVTKGAIMDVFVDLRIDSPTFGGWDRIELTDDNHKMIYIPRGFAHGFCTLTDSCEVVYKVDNVYSPQHEGGLFWMDESLRINWPVTNPIISNKDAALPSFKDFSSNHGGIIVN
ncbi:dTDP-4-dehydrorhamnose 3,5-epimerase [Cohnella kolymensis]|uniref:dTDP-4-dehydrorhamnose 3,5-epimerase n=1 Tax=Cohnella kolymensis TaxID=1590652 RepID=A0ABR5A7I3_9BACL|nr:dTDP-4-dehydrorhamnose 3,5-epimerase [Cohnella kolymensis]KIL36984.1 dTDP-4-dehydrorhamnose 3,5-epimerase [Cohnella kolymensis]